VRTPQAADGHARGEGERLDLAPDILGVVLQFGVGLVVQRDVTGHLLPPSLIPNVTA
jgi:hypothetical protein